MPKPEDRLSPMLSSLAEGKQENTMFDEQTAETVRGRMDDHDLLIRLNTLVEVNMRQGTETYRAVIERLNTNDQRHASLETRVDSLSVKINVVWGMCGAASIFIPLIVTMLFGRR